MPLPNAVLTIFLFIASNPLTEKRSWDARQGRQPQVPPTGRLEHELQDRAIGLLLQLGAFLYTASHTHASFQYATAFLCAES